MNSLISSVVALRFIVIIEKFSLITTDITDLTGFTLFGCGYLLEKEIYL